MTSTHAGDAARSLLWSGRLLLLFAVLMTVHALVALMRGQSEGVTDLAFGFLLIAVAAWIYDGLARGRSWAWGAGLVLVCTGLFFVAPVVGTMLLGGGLEPVGTGWDAIYFPALAALLVGALVLLAAGRRGLGRGSDREG